MKKILNYFFFLLLSIPISGVAQHTFSIVAIDPATGAIGSAGATCLNTLDCAVCTAQIISDIIPGKGAINAQATVCIPNINLNNGIVQLNGGLQAEACLEWLLNNDACTFQNINNRQYGIVTIDDQNVISVKGYTGSEALDEANHIEGPNYAIQGNILIEENVLDSMEAGFLKPGLNFEEQMMAALQGANRPGADSRCFDEGISSKSAYLRIAYPDDPPGTFGVDLLISILPVGQEPIDALQEEFDALNISNITPIGLQEKIINIYPNPIVDGQLHFESLKDDFASADLELYDASGKMIATNTLNNRAGILDYSDLNLEGTYFYKVRSSSGVYLQIERLIFLKK